MAAAAPEVPPEPMSNGTLLNSGPSMVSGVQVRVARFFLVHDTKTEKMYQMFIK
jgi:hypothetical protein